MADLSKRYASALFDISAELGMLAQYLEQATYLRDALQDEECKVFITHPRVSGAEKSAFINRVFAGQLHGDLMGFLHLTVSKNREAFLLPALNALIEMIRAHHHQTTARVVSAVPLSDAQLTKMAALLTRKLNKKVDIQVIVDPAIIGGVSIQADGFYVDRTVRNLLRNMRDEMNTLVKRRTAHDTQA
jgi:F-type H+-transporting ATPase subunit delta